jgi:hypothetical protein
MPMSTRRDDAEGRVSIAWLDDGTPVDRYGRTADEARRHADVVTELAAELVTWGERVRDHVELGRICSAPKFFRRLEVDVGALERVVARDQRYARTLDEAAAREASIRER